MRAKVLTLQVIVAAVLAAASANAQLQTPSTFEFSFSNPGARSLGLGGAFGALADDATAAFANPAGLVQLVSLEVSAELRHWRYTTPFIEGGRYEGEPTGIGLDTINGLRTAVSEEQLTDLSFLSFVHQEGRWSFAVYRHQLANFRFQTATQGLFHNPDPETQNIRALDRRWSTELDIVSYGVAGAYRLSDRFSLGLGIVHFRGRLDAPFEWSLWDDDTLQSYFGPNSYLPERQIANGEMAIDDSDWGLSGGILWTFADDWSLGVFYRQGPDFNLVFNVQGGPLSGLVDPAFTPGATILTVATPMLFPDVYGVGMAYRSPNGKIAVGVEWDRVGYSSIFSGFDPVVIESLDPDLDLEVSLAADDGNEFRLGVEYAFLDLKPVLAVRAGVWLDPERTRSTWRWVWVSLSSPFRSISRPTSRISSTPPRCRSFTAFE
jgi:long-subunit fatty acid transport protein